MYIDYPPAISVPAPTTPEHTEGACVGTGWIPYGSHCYYVGTYINSWEEARVKCMEHSGAYHTDATLASVHSAAENDFIKKTSLASSADYDPWIGLFKQNKGYYNRTTSKSRILT